MKGFQAGYKLLMWWASRGDHKGIVKLLLNVKDIEINAKDDKGYTALILASQRGHKDIVKYLLAKEAEVNDKNNAGSTALMYASLTGHKDIVMLLIAEGANVNDKNNAGYTALIWASIRGHKDVVEILLAEGADVNAKDCNGSTALIEASYKDHRDIAMFLLDKGADVNAIGNDGSTALTFANNNLFLSLKTFGAGNADPEKNGWNSVMWAAVAGSLTRCISLINSGEYVPNNFLKNNGLTKEVKVFFEEYINSRINIVSNIFREKSLNINVSSAISEYLTCKEILLLKAIRKQDERQESQACKKCLIICKTKL